MYVIICRFVILTKQIHPLAISLPYQARNDKHVKLIRDLMPGGWAIFSEFPLERSVELPENIKSLNRTSNVFLESEITETDWTITLLNS